MGNIRTLCKTAMVIMMGNGYPALATVYDSNGSSTNIQYIHNTLAQNGDTISIPTGTFTWTLPVTISKAVKLKGQGSGRIIGNSKSQIAIGTGSKTFTTTRTIPGITAGQVIRVAKMPIHSGPGRENYMEGTVTSYSGTTLVLNVMQTGGSGTYKFWWIATKPATTIINNCSSVAAIQVDQPGTGSVEISGIQGVNTAGNSPAMVSLGAATYAGSKTLIHDCWFQQAGAVDSVLSSTNRCLIWSCSFDDTFSEVGLGLHLKMDRPQMEPSWSSPSTWGATDTNGATNFYIEDCDFHAYLNATDFDDNTRAVFRYNRLDNSGMASHGADSSPVGLRHVEIYNNELIFDNFGDCDGSVTLNVNWFFWQRGGSSVITDNILPAINSCAWGSKGNVLFSVLNIERSEGCYSCWTSYPAPHQIGQGYGNGAVYHSSSCNQANYGYYYIYSEPVYIWNNTGSGGNNTGLNADADECGNNQQLANYVQQGRDYIIGPKPGYQKFTYPHPLRGVGPSPTPTPGPSPSPTATATPTATSPPSPTPTATATPTATSPPSPTPTATGTPRPTPTATATPKHTPRPRPTRPPR
jgi:hypothetical protein